MCVGVRMHTRVFVCGMPTYVRATVVRAVCACECTYAYVCVNIHMHRYILHTIRHLVAVCVCMCARMSTFSMHSVFMCVDECTSQCYCIIWLLP